MAISKLKTPDVPYASLTVDEALAQMKSQVSERFAAWPYRSQALAAVRYVADYFGLPMSERAVRRTAFGLMENGYDADRLSRAKRCLLVDPGFAQRRRSAQEAVVVEASDFECALREARPVLAPSAASSTAAARLPDERPPAGTSATPARN